MSKKVSTLKIINEKKNEYLSESQLWKETGFL